MMRTTEETKKKTKRIKGNLRSNFNRAGLAKLHLALVSLGMLLCTSAFSAMMPQVSTELMGQPLGFFMAQTLDGEEFSSLSLRGKSVVYNFFTSWCPVCSQEIAELKTLQPELEQRGIVLIGILADSVETPDTLTAAKDKLKRAPLPYPVIEMNPSMKKAFHYQGFPATYLVASSGEFTTTLYGFQPASAIRSTLDQISKPPGVSNEIALKQVPVRNKTRLPIQHQPVEGGQTAQEKPRALIGSSRVASPSSTTKMTPEPSVVRHAPWESAPIAAFFPNSWKYWHPLFVHFPIVLLILEVGVLFAFLLTGQAQFSLVSLWLLWLALLSLVPTFFFGLRDSGIDINPESPVISGFFDRASNFWQPASAVSLHVIFAMGVLLLTSGRLIWRYRCGERIWSGKSRWFFVAVSGIGLWLLFAAGQVGGGISHL